MVVGSLVEGMHRGYTDAPYTGYVTPAFTEPCQVSVSPFLKRTMKKRAFQGVVKSQGDNVGKVLITVPDAL